MSNTSQGRQHRKGAWCLMVTGAVDRGVHQGARNKRLALSSEVWASYTKGKVIIIEMVTKTPGVGAQVPSCCSATCSFHFELSYSLRWQSSSHCFLFWPVGKRKEEEHMPFNLLPLRTLPGSCVCHFCLYPIVQMGQICLQGELGNAFFISSGPVPSLKLQFHC